MRSQGKMDSDMIRSFICRSLAAAVTELEPEKKNELSHRGEGLRKMRKVLEEKLESK